MDVSGTVLGIDDRVMNEIRSLLSRTLNSIRKDKQKPGKMINNVVLSSDECYEQNKRITQ